jgi:MYXO-CTERM domain-containing protein
VIDRRSMVFDDKPKPKKDSAPKVESKERALTPDDEAYWAGGPRQAEEKQAALPPPAHMQERPGCGCRIEGPASAASGWGFAALALGLLARRSRRQAA